MEQPCVIPATCQSKQSAVIITPPCHRMISSQRQARLSATSEMAPVSGHCTPFKVTYLRKKLCDFLLVDNVNLHPISQHFLVTVHKLVNGQTLHLTAYVLRSTVHFRQGGGVPLNTRSGLTPKFTIRGLCNLASTN